MLDFKTPLEVFQACQGVLEHNPSTAHLKVYGCRAYPLVHNIGKLEKLEPRAEIGYLLGYDSTNIFRIWVPERHRIVRTRDVTFDESQKYHPDDLRVALANRIEDRIEFIEFLDTEDLDGGVNDEWETRSVNSDISSTIEVIPRDDSDSNILNAQKDSSTDSSIDSRQSEFGLPTPRLTPTPPESMSTPSGSTPATPPDAPDAPDVPDAPIAPQRRQPRQEIFGNPEDPRNIVEGSRTRRPKQRNEAYAADLARPEQMPAYHSAFALGILEGKPKIHEKDLPPPLRF